MILSNVAWGEPIKEIGSHGARGPRVEEPLGSAMEYPIQWRGPRLDLAMLAKLRKVENKAQPIS